MAVPAVIVALLAMALAAILLVRFRPRWVAAFNRAVTNRITGLFAARAPGFGILMHVGRKSQRVYRTPVNVFRRSEGFLIALTYGPECEWVKNVLAAGRCELVTRGAAYHLAGAKVVHDPARRQFPLVVRTVLRLIGADYYMQLSIVPAE
ncbi:MAG: nitroreductase family deazaflavin-dependent oxidoreductase [Candidatus Acidiferrales bacterium]